MANMSGRARRAILSPSGEIIGWEAVKRPTRADIEIWAASGRGQDALKKASQGTDPWDTHIAPAWTEKRGYHWVVRVNPY